MRVRFQQQSEHSECGLACVTMLIDYFVKRINLSSLRKRYGVPNGGYNLEQMHTILEEYGLVSKAAKIDVELIHDLPLPFICYWKDKHFIIIEKITKNSILIIDPASGKQKISYEIFKENFSQIALYITNGSRRKLELPKINPILKSILVNNKKVLLKTFLITLAMQCISVVVPYIIQLIIDENKVIFSYGIMPLVLLVLVIWASYYLVSMIKTRITVNFQTAFDEDFLSKTIKQLLDLPYSYFVNRSKGELVYRINSNTYIREVLLEQISGLIINIMFFFLYLVVMFLYSKSLCIVTLSIAFVLCLFSYISSRINQKISQNEMIVLTKSQNMINELVNNIFTIKSTNAQACLYNKWKKNFDEQIFLEKKRAKYMSVIANIPFSLEVFYPLIVFILGYFLILQQKMTLGSVIAFSSIGVSFLSPMLSIMNSYGQLLMLKIYIDRLLDILETPTELIITGRENVSNYQGRITMKNISYRYSYFSDKVLNNVSLDIRPNEKIAIVGETGSGKSTLLKIASTLYQATEGEIFFDGNNLEKLNIQRFREDIGVVLQENVLFSGTIRENISMGRSYSTKEIWKCIKETGLKELVESFPLGLETNISESGQNLSGGQRQKISIARAIISNPKVLFLDEPTSALDNESEKNIMECLLNMHTTLVVVAHRLSMIEEFDRIIVMRHGRIIESGTHEELLSQKKYYYELYHKK